MGQIGRGIAEEIREMPLANAMLMLIKLIEGLPDELLKKGVITADKLKACRKVVRSLLNCFFGDLTEYVKDFINNWRRLFKQMDIVQSAQRIGCR